jgi:hypothetical protein
MKLSADDDAMPEERALRIHDASAVRFAWIMCTRPRA